MAERRQSAEEWEWRELGWRCLDPSACVACAHDEVRAEEEQHRQKEWGRQQWQQLRRWRGQSAAGERQGWADPRAGAM